MKRPLPLDPTHPAWIFYYVRREDRAAYVRMMRRTLAVHYRDLDRSIVRFQRAIEKELRPAIEKLSVVLDRLLG